VVGALLKNAILTDYFTALSSEAELKGSSTPPAARSISSLPIRHWK
jgi:hypothetical protein